MVPTLSRRHHRAGGYTLASPEDLRGLRIGIPETFGASYIGLRALLKAGGLTEADIDLQTIGYTQLAALTAGTVDAVVVYANNEPVVLAQEGIALQRALRLGLRAYRFRRRRQQRYDGE